MEVIIDTCVLINAVFDQPEHEDDWRILRFVLENSITPIVCSELHREYLCTPQKIIYNEMSSLLKSNLLTPELFEVGHEKLFDYSIKISRVLRNAIWFDVESSFSLCVLHHADDKLVNLSYDSDCSVIITDNIRHLEIVEENGFRTKKGRNVKVYTPSTFYTYYQQMQFQARSKVKY
jgi:predicted nucleic acid-binding protein